MFVDACSHGQDKTTEAVLREKIYVNPMFLNTIYLSLPMGSCPGPMPNQSSYGVPVTCASVLHTLDSKS